MFARVSWALSAQGYEAPVLVGGAAVELYSTGAILTGNFDIVTARQAAFESVLQEHGFVRPSGLGVATRGWVHPEFRLGFEVVSSTLLDRLADRERIKMIDLGEDGSASIISLEDMIADRMGQFALKTAPEMLDQACALAARHSDMDRAYLTRRIIEETAGELSIEDLEEHPFR